METAIIITTSVLFLISLIIIFILAGVRDRLVSSMVLFYDREQPAVIKNSSETASGESKVPLNDVLERLDGILRVQSEILYNTLEMRLQGVREEFNTLSYNRKNYPEGELLTTAIQNKTEELHKNLLQRKEDIAKEIELNMVVKSTTVQSAETLPAHKADENFDEAEDQKMRAAERIQKLRNLSYNLNNSADANNEFDAVPAYIRRNMELFGNTLTSVENFYSKYTVGKDKNDDVRISSINTFLDGKKPD